MPETPEFAQTRIAQLSPEALAKIQAVERQLGGRYVIAYEQPVVPAKLTPEQLNALQAVEREIGACLVAYEKR